MMHGKHDAAKADSSFSVGMWIGRDPDSGEHLIATLQSVVKSRSIRRRIPSERWNSGIIQSMKAVPWGLKGDGSFDPTFIMGHQPDAPLIPPFTFREPKRCCTSGRRRDRSPADG